MGSAALKINPSELVEQTTASILPMAPKPTPARQGMRPVRIADDRTIFEDRLLRRGEVIEVPLDTARSWLRDGRAVPAHLIKVKALIAFLEGRRWRETSEEFEVEEHRAIHLHEHGVARILNPEALNCDLPPVRKPDGSATRPDPWASIRRVAVDVIGKAFLWNNRVHAKGDRVEMPETRAAEAIDSGVVELAPGEALSPAAYGRPDALSIVSSSDEVIIPPAG
jgi:hypothetical protein